MTLHILESIHFGDLHTLDRGLTDVEAVVDAAGAGAEDPLVVCLMLAETGVVAGELVAIEWLQIRIPDAELSHRLGGALFGDAAEPVGGSDHVAVAEAVLEQHQ